jgi:hypothetical protein
VFDARRRVIGGGDDDEDQQQEAAARRLKDADYWLCSDCFHHMREKVLLESIPHVVIFIAEQFV